MGLPLVTLADYKAYALITSTTQDTAINSLIPKVSSLVKSICRTTFLDYVNDAKVEVYSGGFGPKLYLQELPLLTVSSVEYSEDYGNTYTSLVEFTDYIVDLEDNSISRLGSTLEWPKKINGYKVTYYAGYETLPQDLYLAILDLITYYLKNEASVHSTRAPGGNTVQIEYITNTKLPAHISRVLDLYTSNFN